MYEEYVQLRIDEALAWLENVGVIPLSLVYQLTDLGVDVDAIERNHVC